MAITEKISLKERVRRFVRSGDMVPLRIALGVTSIIVLADVAVASANHPNFADMATGFTALAVLCFLRAASSLAFGYYYLNADEKSRHLIYDWVAGGVLRTVIATLLLLMESHVLGHGIRGSLWVGVIAYQYLAAASSFITAYGLRHGFDRFNPRVRKQARAEEAIISDLLGSLEKKEG